jgi:hypothetical protein
MTMRAGKQSHPHSRLIRAEVNSKAAPLGTVRFLPSPVHRKSPDLLCFIVAIFLERRQADRVRTAKQFLRGAHMTYPNNNRPVRERGMSSGAIAALVVFCLIIAGALVYAFRDNGSNATASGTTATSTTGQSTPSTAAKNNIGGQQGTHAGQGGGAAPSNK